MQYAIRFCNFYYCEIADAGGWYTDKRSSEQNGYASRLFWSSRNVKKLKNCIAAKAAQFLYETCAPYHRYGQGFICLSGMRVSAYNGWIFRRKIHSLPRVIFNKKLCEPNGMQHPILWPRSVPYVHQQYRILYLQKSIHSYKKAVRPGLPRTYSFSIFSLLL